MQFGGLVLLAVLATPAVASEPPVVMQYEDGLLTVRLERVPLDRVVERLAQETGIRFDGELLDWREVTKRFEALPLSEALDRILGRQNFILRYDAAGHPASVELCGLPQPRQTPKTRAAPSPANALQVLAAAPAVALTPALRTALHTSTANLVQLFLAALRQPDEGVRAEARRAFLAAVRANREVRAALPQADPKSIIPLVRSLPAARADALLLELGQGSGDAGLRTFFLRTRAQLQQDRAVRSGQSRG